MLLECLGREKTIGGLEKTDYKYHSKRYALSVEDKMAAGALGRDGPFKLNVECIMN